MYFNFVCSSCGKTLKVREELAGRKAKCPYCRSAVSVPDRSATDEGAGEEPPTPGGSAAGPTSTAGSTAGLDFAVRTPSAAAGPVLPQIAVGPKPGSTAGVGPPGLPSRPRVQPRPGSGRKKPAANENDDGTNVSMLWTALAGLGVTVAYYIILLPLPAGYFRDLFYDRGWVTVAETFLLFWSLTILVFKSVKLRRQRESMLFDLLPDNLGRDITVESVGRFASGIRDLPVNPGSSFLVQRVLRGLEHFTVRRSASEVSTVLASQSELDSNAVSSSYALLNVFIWAIPILGFIGTVQGLGSAVGNLSGSLKGATDIESVKTALSGITGGLGVAFDTTLVALIMALFLKFPASSLQKAEEDLLNWVDEYCNENLLKRLQDGGGDDQLPDVGAVGQVVKRAIDVNLAEIVEHARQSVSLIAEQGQTAQRQMAQSVQQSADTAARAAVALVEHLQLMQQAVANMNEILGKLDGKQVLIQTPERPRRRWGLFRHSGAEES